MISARWLSRTVALCVVFFFAPILAWAQSVVITSPVTSKLQTATPAVTAQLRDFPASERPLRFTLYVTGTVFTDNPYIDTVSVETSDSVATLLVSKLLPSDGVVNFRVRVTVPGGFFFDSEVLGPYQLPTWLTLIRPSPLGGTESTRSPTFVWSSVKIDPSFGKWKYDLQIKEKTSGRNALSAGGIVDTTFTLLDSLLANTSYVWQVHAVLQHGEEATAVSTGVFVITDVSISTTNLLYQNFPNPFPSATSFSTCMWFDVGPAGGLVSLDVLDLRGNLVRTIVSRQQFSAGVFGRGISGTGGLCDPRFVWDGTATNGRTVPRGIYLLRLIVSGSAPSYKKIDFLGR